MSDVNEPDGGSEPDYPDPGEQYHNMPTNLQTLVSVVGIIDAEELEEDAAEVLRPAYGGQCMTCRAPLGQSTVMIVNKHGIGAMYCGGACMQDMAVLGWLQEEHDDIVDRVAFRGGVSPDGADNEPDG